MADKVEYKTVQEYIDMQPERARKALMEIKACILKVAPGATELFNYNIPAYSLTPNGKREQQIMIAGYKNHVGLYPHPTTMEKFEQELKEFKRAKGCPDIDVTMKEYMFSGIPTLYLIDKERNIVTKYTGYSEDLENQLKEIFASNP